MKHERGEDNAYRILVGKPEGKRLLRRPRSRWMDDTKMDIRESNQAQEREQCRAVVNPEMNVSFP
jgi:hypothetical protein